MSAGEVAREGERLFTVPVVRARVVRDLDVVIMDEATSSIDAESERLIEEATATLLAGRTAIVIAHRLSTIRSVDRILVLNDGRWRRRATMTPCWPASACTPSSTGADAGARRLAGLRIERQRG